MSIDVCWDDKAKTIIRWDFGETWTWDEFRLAFKTSREMGNHLPYRVDVIPNATKSPHMPLGALSEFKRLDHQLPDNVYLIVVAGTSAFTHAMIDLFSKVYRANSWRTVTTIEEARKMIIQDREKSLGITI